MYLRVVDEEGREKQKERETSDKEKQILMIKSYKKYIWVNSR